MEKPIKLIIFEGNSNDKNNTRVFMVKGEKGYSAYDLYVQNGGTLTEEEWLDSFVNADNYYDKTEIDSALSSKADTEDLSTVATSGSYTDLSDKPTIPTIKNTYSTSETDSYSASYINNNVGVVESGTDNNGGYYVKFADGTMIITQNYYKDINVQTAWGSMYVSSIITTENYPKTFTSKPVVNIFLESNGDAGIIIPCASGTTSKPANVQIASATQLTSARFFFEVQAIGKWK